MHRLTVKKLYHLPYLSDETYAFSAYVYIDNKVIGRANNSGSGRETNFQPNEDGQAYLTNIVGRSRLIELIDDAVHTKIAYLTNIVGRSRLIELIDDAVHTKITDMSQLKKEESGSAKAILINAKDNTMSYFFTDADGDFDDTMSYFFTDADGDFDVIRWGMGFDTKIEFLGSGHTEIFVEAPFNHGVLIRDGDWGFYINIQNRDTWVDPALITPGPEYNLNSKYDGSYDTHPKDNWPNSLGGYRYLGHAVIITDEFTIEQLAQMVKCFYMKKIDDPDAVLARYDKYGRVEGASSSPSKTVGILEKLSQIVKSLFMKKADNPDVVLSRFDLIEYSSHPKIIEFSPKNYWNGWRRKRP